MRGERRSAVGAPTEISMFFIAASTRYTINMNLKSIFIAAGLCGSSVWADKPLDHLVFEPKGGPEKGKHVVLLAGDEEYRSEETMPMLAELLANHGFKATVLFSVDKEGKVDPMNQASLSHSESLDSADAIVMSIRFRNWDDAAMERFEAAFSRGVPMIGMRTSTHAFRFPEDSQWAKYSFNAKKSTGWEGGFGRQVLGETWVSHHGHHRFEGTRSHIEEANAKHPVLRGVGEIFATTDVYGADPKPEGTAILLRGEVTESFHPDSQGVAEKNQPMQPLAWVREYRHENGTVNKIFTTTLGSSNGFPNESLRRLLVNSVYWGLDLEVPAHADVTLHKAYNPTNYLVGGHLRGLYPEDFKLGGKANDIEQQQFIASAGNLDLPKAKLKKGKKAPEVIPLKTGARVAFIGGGLGSRMMHFNHFETELQLRHPEKLLELRNMCDEGNTPGFRQDPSRGLEGQFAFPGAKALVPAEFTRNSRPVGHRENPDQWLARHNVDTIVAFFGGVSAFRGEGDLERYKKEFRGFIEHTLKTRYNRRKSPQLAVVSPMAMQDLSAKYDTPDGKELNRHFALYTKAMQEICKEYGVLFVDLFTPSKEWYKEGVELTTDGHLLNDAGYKKLAPFLAEALFGEASVDENKRSRVHAAVTEKNWFWHNDYKVPNSVHVNGRRYDPYGPANYPFELYKTRQMTAYRDQAIWAILNDREYNLGTADEHTLELPAVKTNYKPSAKNGDVEYKAPEKAVSEFILPEGYKMELFASEKEFPRLGNPCQMAFDNQGRLWVSTMESYPHYRIGDTKPKDCLLILEDTDNDGKADKETVFADDLHIPIGFELAPEGVYVSQSGSLVLLVDEDGDDKYDRKEVILSGFDDHDTHHAISAFCADPSGAIVMGEGVFLHSGVETAHGPVYGTNGGFFRYAPQQKKLTRYAQFSIPNPWGTAFDRYGQDFFLHTSAASVSWMTPGQVKPQYGVNMPAPNLIVVDKVRPTSGIEFVSSRHFPDEVQGDFILNNSIGFLGAKQHKLVDKDSGYTVEFRQSLFESKDRNFRPVDLEFAPDGSLYVVDWHNVLIGHMQHNARDPYRDHVHGRIYRVTYPSRPLVEPAKIAGASIEVLLNNLKLPEYRSRYRTKRELRGRDATEVAAAAVAWAKQQDDDHAKLEALWVTWGANQINQPLLEELLDSENHKVRAAAARVIRFNIDKLSNTQELYEKIAKDKHGRVRLEAAIYASYLEEQAGLSLLELAKQKGVDSRAKDTFRYAEAALKGTQVVEKKVKIKIPKYLPTDRAKGDFRRGYEIYHQEGFCGTCHQADGKGLPDAGFPPLAGSEWVTGSKERLIKLTLKGLVGPIEVNGKQYPGHVPMTAFERMLTDREMSRVLTYVRNSFGNRGDVGATEDTYITEDMVRRVRAEVSEKKGFYTPAELLKEHPLEN